MVYIIIKLCATHSLYLLSYMRQFRMGLTFCMLPGASGDDAFIKTYSKFPRGGVLRRWETMVIGSTYMPVSAIVTWSTQTYTERFE